ncbi:hypothetical protein [Micromonospora sp. KC213]|nr:hypothetical protein [Micromonospora sp. KC213]
MADLLVAERLYLAGVDPLRLADVVIDKHRARPAKVPRARPLVRPR